MNFATGLSLVVSCITIISFFAFRAVEWGKMQQRLDTIEGTGCGKLQEIDKKVERLIVQMEPFWNLVETRIASSLKSPHTPEYDMLLDLLKNSMSREELEKLKTYVLADSEEATVHKDCGRVFATAMVLSRVEARLRE